MKFTESEWRPKRLVINGWQWIIDAFSFSDFNFIFKKDIVGSKNPIPPFLSACKIFRHLDTGFITMTYSFKNCSSIGVMNSSFSSTNNFFHFTIFFLEQTNETANSVILRVPASIIFLNKKFTQVTHDEMNSTNLHFVCSKAFEVFHGHEPGAAAGDAVADENSHGPCSLLVGWNHWFFSKQRSVPLVDFHRRGVKGLGCIALDNSGLRKRDAPQILCTICADPWHIDFERGHAA